MRKITGVVQPTRNISGCQNKRIYYGRELTQTSPNRTRRSTTL